MDTDEIRNRYAQVTTGHKHKNPIDFAARRNFVYTLADAAGVPIYVGRSHNVAQRIRSHIKSATHSGRAGDAEFAAGWVYDIRSVSMDGPFTWDEAVAEERRQIKSKLPRGNRCGIPKGLAS